MFPHIHTFTHPHIHTFTHPHIHTITHSHIHTHSKNLDGHQQMSLDLAWPLNSHTSAQKRDTLDIALWSVAAELMSAGYDVKGTALLLASTDTNTHYRAVFCVGQPVTEWHAIRKRAIKSMPTDVRTCVVVVAAEAEAEAAMEWNWTWVRNLDVPGGYVNDGTVEVG